MLQLSNSDVGVSSLVTRRYAMLYRKRDQKRTLHFQQTLDKSLFQGQPILRHVTRRLLPFVDLMTLPLQ